MPILNVYEDSYILVVNKPSGLLVIPAPKNESPTLIGILNRGLQKKGINYRLHPCHRLDRETSGLIILAKGKGIQKKMMEEFKRKGIKKTYVAFIQGVPNKDRGRIDYSIEGKCALTKYKVIKRYKDFSIVEVMPVSGRRNQIRIHFKKIRHPIVGESKYAFRRDFKLRFRRLCLHAKSLRFRHPITKKYIFLDIDLPIDLRRFLSRFTEQTPCFAH
jgi:23S rRNA pseudouridine1911/1915/1917 synthase